jgi:CRP-like cAMP-binding protein
VPLILNSAAFEKSFATLPTASFQAGETVFLAGSRTGRLLILKKGAVVVSKDGVEIAKVSEPGAVFGELSILLDHPTPRMCVPCNLPSFTSPTSRFLHKTSSHASTSPRPWPDTSITPIALSLS